MELTIKDRSYELNSYNISIRFKPYDDSINCELNEEVDIDELSQYIENNYEGDFSIEEKLFSGYSRVGLNVYHDGKKLRKTLNFDKEEYIGDEEEA